MMARVLLIVALIAIVGYASSSAVPSYPVYIVPAEHRTATELKPFRAAIEDGSYEYQLVPADEYEVAEVAYDTDVAETSIVSSIASSIWEALPIPNPFAVLKKIGSKVLSVAKWVLKKGVFVLIGVALTVAFCAFTPFCTLVIEKPFARQISALNIPYLDEAEQYLRQAYDKYHELY